MKKQHPTPNIKKEKVKKTYLAIIMALLAISIPSYSQPAPVKNAAKSIFTLTTFKADGSLLASSHGVFTDAAGTAISDWAPFDGASRAVVVDANGKSLEVDYIYDANEIYDVVKFHVKGKTTGLTLAPAHAATGDDIYLVTYSLKKPEVTATKVEKVETFMEKYAYYVMKMMAPENAVGCPLVNANGQLLGFLQQSRFTTDYHSTDAQYITDMQTTGLTCNDPVMRRTFIPTAIPDDKEQAQLALVLSSQDNNDKYAKTAELFIEKFPDLADGYSAKAQLAVNNNDFAAAKEDMETAIKKATAKDEAHFTYARLIYQKELYKFDQSFPAWNLDKAIEEAQQANSINPQPLYRHLEAQIRYTKKEYQQAYGMFIELTNSNIRNPELFYEAAQCKTMLEAPKEETVALLDSAMALFAKPYPLDAAPYVLYRAAMLEDMGEYRRAVADYNQYDSIMTGRIGADFYYKREQCEVKGRLFKQALDDIDTAIRMAPKEPLYLAEKASLQLRVNMKEEALETVEKAIALDPEYGDAYLIKGLSLIQLGKKKEGLEVLEKAQQLGNEQASGMIEKYK